MKHLLTFAFLLITASSISQITVTTIKSDLKTEITNVDGDNSKLLTNVGLNVLLQKRVINYLTGVSDLSLAKFYAAYTADNDKLNIGFNFPVQKVYSQRISFIINPIIEADVKNNFATLYKDGKWKNNIRGGLKLTWLPGKGKINFDATNTTLVPLKILRSKKYDAAIKELDAYSTQVTIVDGSKVTPIMPDASKLRKKKKELYADLGKSEAELVEKEGSYKRMRTYWFSLWAYAPLTKTEQYIAKDASQLFTKKQFHLWEVNLQGTYLYEWRKYGTLYGSAWIKHYQNNSANASLMTNVDYGQYSQFPGINQINLALLETNKAYIGDYKEFLTTNLNVQVVYFFPVYDRWIKPGISFRYEKNWGDYSPSDIRFGLPIAIQGKEKPINIELQYRLNDIANYKNDPEHKIKKTVGVSLGFPIALLYK